MALKVESLMPISEFKSKVDKLIESIRNSPKAPGVKEILIPGEPEFRNRKRRLKEGISIPDSDWANIKKIAEKLNVKIDI
jgi:LDH2 family malate/lactate/ureidoglycolate dehydrogenase